MRVAIDTSALYTARAGIHRYFRGVFAGLASLGERVPEVRKTAGPIANYGYRQPGRARARMFSWERCARETFAVYCRAVGARSIRG